MISSELVLVQLNDGEGTADDQPPPAPAPAFLQIGDWTYPLIAQKSPVYKSFDGTYMFPDLREVANGRYANISKKTPLAMSF